MVDFLIVLFGVTMLYVAATSRLEVYIKMLAAQGFILFLLVLLDFNETSMLNLIFVSIETLVVKTLIVPLFLMNVVRKNDLFREIDPNISNFYSIVTASVIFAFGFFVSYWLTHITQDIRALYFGISISTMITGLYIIVSRKKVITHVMGYMMLENGIFLLSLSIAKEMPIIVSLGIVLDIFVAVFLLGLFINKIQMMFEETHIDTLTNLKD